jgi:hypothetical protein
MRPLTTGERARIRAGTAAIYVYGEMDYTDAFGESRYTKYRFFSNDTYGLAEGKTGDTGQGNEAK